MTHQHDREFFRLQYPPPAAPAFILDGVSHRVVDIGEGGFRYALVTDGGPIAGRTIKGSIEFEDEDTLELEGTVVRTQDGEVAVRCPPRSIPLAVIIREQQRVRRRYPFRP
jgi:PilZ domain-containing protein